MASGSTVTGRRVSSSSSSRSPTASASRRTKSAARKGTAMVMALQATGLASSSRCCVALRAPSTRLRSFNQATSPVMATEPLVDSKPQSVEAITRGLCCRQRL